MLVAHEYIEHYNLDPLMNHESWFSPSSCDRSILIFLVLTHRGRLKTEFRRWFWLVHLSRSGFLVGWDRGRSRPPKRVVGARGEPVCRVRAVPVGGSRCSSASADGGFRPFPAECETQIATFDGLRIRLRLGNNKCVLLSREEFWLYFKQTPKALWNIYVKYEFPVSIRR